MMNINHQNNSLDFDAMCLITWPYLSAITALTSFTDSRTKGMRRWNPHEQRIRTLSLTLHARCLQSAHVCLHVDTCISGWLCFCLCMWECLSKLVPLSERWHHPWSQWCARGLKREENCSGYMWPDSFTCVHTHAYKRKQRWADREACSNHTAWILLYVLATCWYLFKELHSCALCHCVHTCVQRCFGFGLRHQLRWC